jgi:hypothetical protein
MWRIILIPPIIIPHNQSPKLSSFAMIKIYMKNVHKLIVANKYSSTSNWIVIFVNIHSIIPGRTSWRKCCNHQTICVEKKIVKRAKCNKMLSRNKNLSNLHFFCEGKGWTMKGKWPKPITLWGWFESEETTVNDDKWPRLFRINDLQSAMSFFCFSLDDGEVTNFCLDFYVFLDM